MACNRWYWLLLFRYFPLWLLFDFVEYVELANRIILQLDDYLVSSEFVLRGRRPVLVLIYLFGLLRTMESTKYLFAMTRRHAVYGWTILFMEALGATHLTRYVRVLARQPTAISPLHDGAVKTVGIATLYTDFVSTAKVALQACGAFLCAWALGVEATTLGWGTTRKASPA